MTNEKPKTSLARTIQMMEGWFSLDLRSLALFRILMGALILVDLAIRSTDLTMFYSDQGILPRWLLLLRENNHLDLNLYLLGGHWLFAALLFAVTAGFAVMYLFGYRTRLASIGLWFMMFSLHARNGMVNNRGDALLLLILFWSMFLPMGAYFSIDSSIRREPPPSPRLYSMAAAGLLLQVVMLYWFSIVHKSGDGWRYTGHALIYSLHTDTFVTSLGIMLRQLPLWLLNGMSRAVYLCEILAPLLLFSPWQHGRLRTLGVLFLVGLHTGFIFFIELGMFAYIDIIVLLSLLPPAFWEFLAKRKQKRTGKRPMSLPLKPYRPSRWSEWFMGFCIVYVFWWNLGTIRPTTEMPESLSWFGDGLRLSQRWDMFSPDPPPDDNWYVVPALLNDGTWVDLFKWVGRFHGKIKLDWKHPKLLSARFKNSRWVDYFSDLLTDYEEKPARRHRNGALFTHYMCRSWNQSHRPPRHLKKVMLYVMDERVTIRNKKAIRASAARKMMSNFSCEKAATIVESQSRL